MSTEKFTQIRALQLIKLARLEQEIAWLTQATPEDLLDL